MSDSASTDSFETFKSEELAEGEAIKSLSSGTDEDFRTARDMVSSSTDANYFTAEAAADEATPDSTLKDVRTLTYVREAMDQSLVSSSTLDDQSWQDLEQDTLSTWVNPPSGDNDEKRAEIRRHLGRHDSHTRLHLRKLALSAGGLVDDELRRKVWPKLAKADVIETSPRPDQAEMEKHPFYQQVILDVNRSLKVGRRLLLPNCVNSCTRTCFPVAVPAEHP